MAFHWTDENIELTKKLWNKGLSGGEIAARINAPSASSVIGKIHRLGLPPRPQDQHRRPYGGRPAREQTSFNSGPRRGQKGERFKDTHVPGATVEGRAPNPKADPHFDLYKFATVEDVIRKPLIEAEPNDCRYIIGDPKHPFPKSGICGLPKMSGNVSYCPGHFRRCTEKTYFEQRAKAVVEGSIDRSLKLPAPETA